MLHVYISGSHSPQRVGEMVRDERLVHDGDLAPDDHLDRGLHPDLQEEGADKPDVTREGSGENLLSLCSNDCIYRKIWINQETQKICLMLLCQNSDHAFLYHGPLIYQNRSILQSFSE